MKGVTEVAHLYADRGYQVKILNPRRVEVTAIPSGTSYRVTARGRAVTGKELEAEIAKEKGAVQDV